MSQIFIELPYNNQYLASANSALYFTGNPTKSTMNDFAVPNVQINPDISEVEGVPVKYWKKGAGNTVVEMSSEEKEAVENYLLVRHDEETQTIYLNLTGNTEDATPTVIYSYPVGVNKCIKCKMEYTAYKEDFTTGASGDLFATFLRANGGLSRTGGTGSSGLDGVIQGNFSGSEPKPDLIVNSNNIDVTLNGKDNTNIIWQVKLTIIPYT